MHQTINMSRRRKMHQAESLNEQLIDDDAQSGSAPGSNAEVAPPARAQAAKLQTALDKALAKLNEKHRTVFVLYTVKGLSYKEIADAIGISIGTVISRL